MINESSIIFDFKQILEILRIILIEVIAVIPSGIIYFGSKKYMKSYKVYKDFKAQSDIIVSLPPKIENKNLKFDKKELLKQKYSSRVVRIVEKLVRNKSSIDLILLYNNLASIKISSKLMDHNINGTYEVDTNEILININANNANKNGTLAHEILHAASTCYRVNNDVIFVGFYQERDKKSIANGLNEGYTQLLTERYFGDNSNAYEYEIIIASRLEMIIGKEKMESLYFSADLNGIIQELSKYENQEAILNFINDLDFVSQYLFDNDFIFFKKKMTKIKLIKINQFLINCYARKLSIDFDLNKEQFKDMIYEFVQGLSFDVNIKNKLVYKITNNDLIENILLSSNKNKSCKCFVKK